MDDLISKLKTPKDCATLEKNAADRGRPDVALAARKRRLQLLAEEYGATSDVERECLAAVYAYEQVLTHRNGRPTRANRTWPMIERHGIIGAVERAVDRPAETVGYQALQDMGLGEFAFEAVILRHPSHFSPAAVERSRQRIETD
ncbi:hypothetical protein ACLUTX_12660 [Enterobacterales bacterium AE_CKDN230030158-1A_HGKHYDSX7]